MSAPDEEESHPFDETVRGWASLLLGILNTYLTLNVFVEFEIGKSPGVGNGPHMEGLGIIILLFWIAILGFAGIVNGVLGKKHFAGRIGLILNVLSYAGSVAAMTVNY